jgi:hypothetical protein
MEPNWRPLEAKLGRTRCVGFMYMGRVSGINLYKHGIARMYLALDDRGQCYRYCANACYHPANFEVEIGRIEAALRAIDESLESVYDEDYITRKQEALRRAGIPLVRIEIEPEDATVN